MMAAREMEERLSEKQRAALVAVCRPGTNAAHTWWEYARVRWPGARKTLGSLYARALVDYHEFRNPMWQPTLKGLHAAHVCISCRQPLDVEGKPGSLDCGGDCLACVTDAEGS